MRIPTIRGLIDRRVLVNFRVEPDVLSAILPTPFRPQIVNGFGIAGICLIRLKHIRPKFLPPIIGISSENWDVLLYVDNVFDDDTVKSAIDVGSQVNTARMGVFPPGPTDGVVVSMPDPRIIGLRAGYRF